MLVSRRSVSLYSQRTSDSSCAMASAASCWKLSGIKSKPSASTLTSLCFAYCTQLGDDKNQPLRKVKMESRIVGPDRPVVGWWCDSQVYQSAFTPPRSLTHRPNGLWLLLPFPQARSLATSPPCPVPCAIARKYFNILVVDPAELLHTRTPHHPAPCPTAPPRPRTPPTPCRPTPAQSTRP